MSDINQAAEDLFFKLRNRFPKIKLGDENGRPTVDPEKARFFNFPYTDKDSNRNYGDISCSLIDGSSLKVFFDTAITERMLPEDKDYWYRFLRELRRMAKGHMLNFDVRDITKDTLSRRDYEYMIKLNPEKKKMKESLEESRVLWQRRGKFSEGTLNNVRINVVHNEKMLENPNNRLLKVDRIYLVNENGEKFLLPFKSVGGAKAMANHVSRGGNPYDLQGQIISRAISEMKNLSRFTSVTRNRTFESAEAGDVITAAQQMKESIKRHVTRLTHNSRSFSESLEALSNLIGENSEDVSEVKGWFTQQTYNENLDNYLVSAAGAYKKLKEGVFNVQEAASDVEKKILDPNYKLVLKSDPGLDKLMVSRQYTNTTALLTAVLGDIANRMMAKDGDDIANFASLMGDLVSSEGESFGQKSEPEYNRDKKLAIMLAQKYMKDLGEIRKNPEYEKEVRKDSTRGSSAKESMRTEADQFAEEIMSIGEEEVEESGLQYYTGKKKYGKEGMAALAKAGRDGASQEELGKIQDKYMKKEDAVSEGTMTAPVEINGKQVDVHSLEVVIPDTSDYPDFSDAHFAAGQYTDGTPIDDQDLDDLARTHGDLLHGMSHDQFNSMDYNEGVNEAGVNLGGKIGAGALALGLGATAVGMMGDDKPVPYMVKASSHGGYEVVLKRNPSHELVNFDDKEQAYAWIKQKMQPKTKTDPFEDAVNEEPNEGNEFSGALAAAKASGKKKFEVDGKTYQVKEGGSADEPEQEDSDADDKRWDDKEEKIEETKMSKDIMEMRKLAGLPLMENYIYAQEEDKSEDEANAPDTVPHKANEPSSDDKAEYDQEGRMAKSDLKTAKDAADELRSILDDDENLPEWVQAKITKAVDYLDTARDYMKDNDVEYTDENVTEATKKKPDADGDGVPDWADKKPGKDDNADKDDDKSEKKGMSAKQEKYFGKKNESVKESRATDADLTWLQAVAGIVRK